MHAVRQGRVLLPLLMALFLATGSAASPQLATPVVPTETPTSATPVSDQPSEDGLLEADAETDMLLLLNGVHQSVTVTTGDSVRLETVPNTLAVALFSHANCNLPFSSVQSSGYTLTLPVSAHSQVWSARPVDPSNPERVGDCLNMTWAKREVYLSLNGHYESATAPRGGWVIARYYALDIHDSLNPNEPVAATVYQGGGCEARLAIHELPVLPDPTKDYQIIQAENGPFTWLQAYSTRDPSKRSPCLQITWSLSENPPPASPVVTPPTVVVSPEPDLTATVVAPSPEGGGGNENTGGGEHSGTSVAVTSLPDTGSRIARPMQGYWLLLATAIIFGAASVAARFVSNRRGSCTRN